MKTFVVLASLVALSAQAGPVDQAIKNLKKYDVRTTRHVVTEKEADTVCTAAGDTIVELQVKKSMRQESNGTISIGHVWETVKTINISPKGEVMEECLE